MNERIKELAVQADLLIKKTNGDEFRYGNFDPRFQKFAELIVRECIQTIQNESMNSNDEWEYGLRIAQGAIQTHFGVEE